MDFPPEKSYGRSLYPLLQYNESSFIPEPYVPPRIIQDAHQQPRFGRPNNLDGVFNGVQQQTREYVTGVIIGSLIIAIVAVVWLFAIVCLKIAGPKRVGFFSGRFVRPTANPEQKTSCEADIVVEGEKSWNDAVVMDEGNETLPTITMGGETQSPQTSMNFGRRVLVVRVLFVLSGIAVLISGGLFYGKGAVSFKNSFDDIQDGIDMVQTVCAQTMQLTANVTKAANDVEEQSNPQEIGEEPVCSLDSDVSTQIRTIYNELVANIDQLRSTLDERLLSIDGDVLYVLGLMEDIEHALYFADIFFYVLVAITVVIITLIVAMLGGAFFAWKGISNSFTKCIQYALIWPLFIFFMVLSWIFATLFLAAGLAGADFCVTPDQYVEDFMYAHEDKFDGILFGFIIYYVTGCTIIPPGAKHLAQISTEIAAVMTTLHELIPLIADLPVESIAQLCNVSIKQATTLKGITALGHTIIHALNQSFVGLRQVLSCSTMNPIYTIFVHQALCEEAVAGMSWIFFTTLFLAIFSMLLLMFRAALYPISDFALPASSSDEDGIEVVKKCNEQPQHAPDEVVENDNACAVNAENNLPPNANVTTQSDASAHVDAPAQDDSAHPESNGEIGRVDDAK